MGTAEQAQVVDGVCAAERPRLFMMQLQEGAGLAALAVGTHVTAPFSVAFCDLSADILLDMATLARPLRRDGSTRSIERV